MFGVHREYSEGLLRFKQNTEILSFAQNDGSEVDDDRFLRGR